MRSSFAGIGVLALAATPLAAIPLALPSAPAQAHIETAVEASASSDPARLANRHDAPKGEADR